MENDLLTPEDLAIRWKVTIFTISQWRWNGKGPRFFKQGRQIFYRPQDVLRYEEQKCKKSTSSQDEEEERASSYKIRSQKKRRFK
ncbi:MAG: DNA-binding protein [Alphaproteobacteria bacterium]|nr:DNA-binding protein [Alphaproteobacteria bacterium]